MKYCSTNVMNDKLNKSSGYTYDLDGRSVKNNE